MRFERSDHSHVGNTCRGLLCGNLCSGTQQEPKAHLQVFCKAVATTPVRQAENALICLLVVFCLCKWDGHAPVTVAWVKTTSPSSLGSTRTGKRAKSGGCPLQNSPGWHTCTHGCDTALAVYLGCFKTSVSRFTCQEPRRYSCDSQMSSWQRIFVKHTSSSFIWCLENITSSGEETNLLHRNK